jgi:hypothetical protein
MAGYNSETGPNHFLLSTHHPLSFHYITYGAGHYTETANAIKPMFLPPSALKQLTQCVMRYLVGSQELVMTVGCVHQVMFASVSIPVTDGITPDSL